MTTGFTTPQTRAAIASWTFPMPATWAAACICRRRASPGPCAPRPATPRPRFRRRSTRSRVHERRSGHRAASALGDGPAGRQQPVPQRHRAASQHRVLEPYLRRLGPRMDRRLGGGVECDGRLSADPAAAGRDELVHRLHRPFHTHAVERRPHSGSRSAVGDIRVSRHVSEPREPLPAAVARQARRGGGEEHRLLSRNPRGCHFGSRFVSLSRNATPSVIHFGAGASLR